MSRDFIISDEGQDMRFTKMQGCGNDYIYVNCFEESITDPSAAAIKLSDRRYGIGSDGLILIEPSDKAHAFMHMFNRDGSEGRMCGNGLRCVAKYIYDHGLIPPDRREAVIDTRAGLRRVTLNVADGRVCEVSVDMGKARLTRQTPEYISACGISLVYTGIDLGNPHAVYYLEDNPGLAAYVDGGCKEPGQILADIPIEELGPELEKDERFPDGVNSSFAYAISRNEIGYRVWERGSGETFACGSGATAAAVAGVIAGRLDDEVLVHLKGGDLLISYDRSTGRCVMTGPAIEVFTGTVEID